MEKISVVVNTWNEEKNIERCLKSVKWANEIVVVDMDSTDKTVEIAKKFGAKVFFHKYTFYVEPARNFAISKAMGDWILVFDADEEVPNGLGNTLKKIAKEGEFDFVRIPRKNIIFGKWIKHSRWWPDYNIRFFKKGMVEWSEKIHNVPLTRGEGKDLEAKEINAIVHYHYDSIEQYLERLNRYTTKQAKMIAESGYRFSWRDLIKKPADEFFSRYFFGEGYKDGIHGLALASLQTFSELVLYLKIWQAEKFKEEGLRVSEVIGKMKETDSDFHYWLADTLFKEGASIIQRIKRKFRLP